MIYEEYYKKFLKLKKVKDRINKLENKKINLMSNIEVKSNDPSKDTIKVNNVTDAIGNYVAELEIVENDLIKEKEIKKEIMNQLADKEEDLRSSKEVLDQIYLYKFIDKLKYHQICKKINYEKSSFYKFLDEIKEKLHQIKRMEKNGK